MEISSGPPYIRNPELEVRVFLSPLNSQKASLFLSDAKVYLFL